MSVTTKTTRRTKVKLTARQEIRRYLNLNPGRTAWQIANGIKRSSGHVSAVLCRDRAAGLVRVDRAKGPRGGLAYGRYKTA